MAFKIIQNIENKYLDAFSILNEKDGLIDQQLSHISKETHQVWQPSHLLPDFSDGDICNIIRQFQSQTSLVPDSILIAIIGNMIVEESLPNYQSVLSKIDGLKDETGCDSHPWAKWIRYWSAEENRHGSVLNRYLYLTGRIDMSSVENSIMELLRVGTRIRTEDSLYRFLVYTSFQERITRIYNQRLSKLAQKYGDKWLFGITKVISSDEAKHETSYKIFAQKIFELDPSGALSALYGMLQKEIQMPGSMLKETKDKQNYEALSRVCHVSGIYTPEDYPSVLQHLIDFWKIRELTNLTPGMSELQDYVCNLPERYRKITKRIEVKLKGKNYSSNISWIRSHKQNQVHKEDLKQSGYLKLF